MNCESEIAAFIEDQDAFTGERLAAFVRVLEADPACAARLKMQLHLDEFISRSLSLERRDFPARIRRAVSLGPDDGFVGQVRERTRAIGLSGRRRASARLRWAGAAALVLMATYISIEILRPEREGVTPAPVRARVAASIPGARVFRNGVWMPVTVDSLLYAQDRLETSEGAGLKIRYDGEETWVETDARTRIAFLDARGGKALSLEAGTIYVSAAPQPAGKPLVVNKGRYDQAVILGTTLELSRRGERTTLSVERGLVQFGREGHAVLCRELQRSVATGAGGAGRPTPVAFNEIGTWRPDRKDSVRSGPKLPLQPYRYTQDFETADPFEFWAANGTYTTHFKGLSSERSVSGERSFKFDVTLDTATYLYLNIPVNVPNEGQLRFSGSIWARTPGSGARASIGLNTVLTPCPYGGTHRIYPGLYGPADGWVVQSIDDVVAGGLDNAESLLSRYCARAVPEDTGIWTNRIALFLGGSPGDRLTVYVDDLVLTGDVPDPEAYLAAVTPAWEAYTDRIQATTLRFADAIATYTKPLTYPPDADVLAQIRGRAAAIAQSLKARGHPHGAEFDELARHYDTLAYLRVRTAWVEAHPGEGFIPYTRNPIADERILPEDLIHRHPARTVAVKACPGEHEPVSLIIHARTALTDVTVDVGDFAGERGERFSADRAEVRLVKCWYQAGEGNLVRQNKRILTPELLLKDDRLVAVDRVRQTNRLRVDLSAVESYIDISSSDAVFPDEAIFDDAPRLQPFDVPPYENRELWVTVSVPERTTPGIYSSTVKVAPADGPPQSFSISMRVLPFTLPQPVIEHGIYYRGYVTSREPAGVGADVKTMAQYEREILNMKAHGISHPTFCFGAAKRIGDMLNVRVAAGLPTDRLYCMKCPGNPRSPDELARLKTDLKTWIDRARAYGYGDVYFYGRDCWTGDRLSSQRPAWKAVHEVGGKIFAACSSDAAERVGDLLDVPVLNGHHRRPEQVAAWHQRGKRLFTHGKPQAGVENPWLYRDVFGIRLWTSGYDGVINYAYQHAFGHMWNDFDHGRFRDHVFAYPTSNGLIDTVQWEGYREAIDDLRYLAVLQEVDRRSEAEVRAWLSDLVAAGASSAQIREQMIAVICARLNP
jgi:hypothetical protein